MAPENGKIRALGGGPRATTRNGKQVRVVFVFGKEAGLRYLEVPIWALLATVLALAALLELAFGRWWHDSDHTVTSQAVEAAQRQTRANAEREQQAAMQTLSPLLANLHFQVLQLDSQGNRLATLVGLRNDWREGTMPDDPALLSLRAAGLDDFRREVDFVTRLVELKTDAMSMVELFLIQQRLQASSDYVLPVPPMSRISSGFGLRPDPFTGLRAMHRGIDFESQEGTPVRAVADGLVARVATQPDYGNVVEIAHRDGRATRYGHLKQALVRTGQVVRRGEIIAQVGSTGRSTGPHLHFEALEFGVPLNPLAFFLPRTAPGATPVSLR